jgi:hypothetical protein
MGKRGVKWLIMLGFLIPVMSSWVRVEPRVWKSETGLSPSFARVFTVRAQRIAAVGLVEAGRWR